MGSMRNVWAVVAMAAVSCAVDALQETPRPDEPDILGPTTQEPEPEPSQSCPEPLGLDPAPEFEVPGEYASPECGAVQLTSLTIEPSTASSFSVTGYAPGV